MQVATGALTKVTFTGDTIPATAGTVMIFFICVFVACFAASWGPLGWLVRPLCLHAMHPSFVTVHGPLQLIGLRNNVI